MKRVLFFLGQLNDRDVEWMKRNGNKIYIDKGTTLIQKGKDVDNLYIILSGSLSIVANDLNSVVAVLGAGEIVGEMSFLESRAPSVSVIATSSSSVFVVSKELIYSHMEVNPDFKANFYYALALFLSSRLRKTTDQLGYGLPEDEDLIDVRVLDNVAQAGSRFGQILTKF